jgi:RimJ/RimL family protein N-acetyltransferase
VLIEPWGSGNQELLEQLLADPVMMRHLGGPETRTKIAERQARYERPGSRQYRVVAAESGQGVGWVGYWEREWLDRLCWEIGWAVVPAMQGRGIGSTATALVLDVAREEGSHRYVHAYPSAENAASNGICRKLGFTLLGAHDFEYPAGEWMRCNDWQFDLRPGGGASRPSRPRRQ